MTRSLHILCLDDEPSQLEVFRRWCGRQGHVFQGEADPSAGLALLASRRFDAILLDLAMPKISGMGVLHLLAALPDAPPVIVITGREDLASAQQTMAAGAVDYLIKDPAGDYLDLLPGRLTQALRSHRQARAKARASAALRASRRRYRAVFELSNEAMLLLERDGKVARANRQAAQLWGLPPRKLLGRSLTELVAPSHVAQVWGALTDAAGPHRRSSLWCLPGDQAHATWAEVSLGLVQSDPELILLMARDVTQSLEVRKRLEISERHHRQVVEGAAEMILMIQDGRLVLVNPRACQAFGARREDLLGRHLDQLVHPGDQLLLADLLAHPPDQAQEIQFRINGSKLSWWGGHLMNTPWESGRALLGMFTDITRRVRAESELMIAQRDLEHRVDERTAELRDANQALRGELILRQRAESQLQASQERFTALVDQTPVGIIYYDADGRISFVNQYHREHFATPEQRDHLVGLPVWELPPLVAAGVAQTVRQVLEGRPVELADLYAADLLAGQPGWMSVKALPLLRQDQVTGGILLLEDVTRRMLDQKEIHSLAMFPDRSPNPVLRVSRQGLLEYANQACKQLMGTGHCQPGQPVSDTLLRGLGAGHEEFEVNLGPRTFRFAAAPLEDLQATYLYGRDVTQRKSLEAQRQMAATVFENSIEGIIVADGEGRVQLVNPAYSQITGYDAQEVLGRELNVLRAETLAPEFYEQLWQSLTEHGRWSGEFWNRRKSGEAYPEWLTITVVRDTGGQIVNFIAIFHDITDLKDSQEQIRHQAMHDALTGLPNRNLFNDRLEQAIARCLRTGQKVGVMFVDLDDFKRINDSLGHDVGDLVLKDAARRLLLAVREEDTVARLGGDEFIILLMDTKDSSEAVRVARRILKGFSEPFMARGNRLTLGASLGITIFPEDGADLPTLIKNADLAMYRAKDRGGRSYELFTQAMQEEVSRRLSLENDLRGAIERGELVMHYQPRVELGQGLIMGMEALLRWNRFGRGLVPPGEFIGVAEDSGLILEVGAWALAESCRQAASWLKRGLEVGTLSVNLSPRQFMQQDLLRTVRQALEASGLPPSMLELEITETAMMADTEAAVKVLKELHGMGIHISVDDFGTGYSSLSYLKRFPLSVVKVDRSFVSDLPDDPNDAAIATSIISLAHSLGLVALAEGVETVSQLDFLRDQGCDQVQGYLFSRPVEATTMAELLAGGRLIPRPNP